MLRYSVKFSCMCKFRILHIIIKLILLAICMQFQIELTKECKIFGSAIIMIVRKPADISRESPTVFKSRIFFLKSFEIWNQEKGY